MRKMKKRKSRYIRKKSLGYHGIAFILWVLTNGEKKENRNEEEDEKKNEKKKRQKSVKIKLI